MQLQSPIVIPADPLAGPRTVGDAIDHVRIDPQNARIQYAGSARPTRRIRGSLFSQEKVAAIGSTGANEFIFEDGVDADTWWSFGPLPSWVDETAEVTLFALINCPISLTAPNDTVRLINWIHFQREGSVPSADSGETVDFGFDGGSGYTAKTPAIVTLRTRAGGTFQSGDLISARIHRNATATEDTAATDLLLCDSPWIEVTQKEVA